MLANGWQALFKPHILDRGETYWQQGHVAELRRTPDGIQAVVAGSEDYEVEIELEDGMVCDMYCSCPYAEDGSACKHMAAVLFAAEDCPGDAAEAAGAGGVIPAPVWQETLRQMTAEQLRSFLSEILPHSTGLQEQLLLSYRQGQDDTLLRDGWEAQLQQTVLRFRGGRQEIDYAHADAFYTALNRFLTDRLPALLRAKAVMPAFSLVCAVYRTAMEEEADSSDGGMNLLMHTCKDAWHDLMSAASVRQCVEMHRWFAEQVVSRPDAFGIDLLEEILFCDDWPAECLWKNLALLDDLLEKAPDREYRAAELLDWRADTMQALGLPEADIEAFWSRYRSYSFVRDRERSRWRRGTPKKRWRSFPA